MTKLIVCLDGLGRSMFSKDNAPFMHEFARKNSMATLKTMFAFTGIEFTFFSGKDPTEHDIWMEFIYSPKTSPFKWQKYLRFLGRRMLSVMTAMRLHASGRMMTKLYNIPYNAIGNFDAASRKNVWEMGLFDGKKYVCYKWPILVKSGKKRIILKYQSDWERCRELVKSISDAELYFVHLVGLDKVAHKHYPGKEVDDKIRELDSMMEWMVGEFQKRSEGLEVYLWSDHGFNAVNEYFDMQSMMPKRKDYISFYGGTTASFWFKSDSARKEVKEKLSKLKFGHIMTDAERKGYMIPSSSKHGEIIFSVDPGTMIFPNYYQKSESEKFRAMHGYATDKCDLDGILITNRKLNKKEIEMKDMKGIIRT
jgi:hypothetical protein